MHEKLWTICVKQEKENVYFSSLLSVSVFVCVCVFVRGFHCHNIELLCYEMWRCIGLCAIVDCTEWIKTRKKSEREQYATKNIRLKLIIHIEMYTTEYEHKRREKIKQ